MSGHGLNFLTLRDVPQFRGNQAGSVSASPVRVPRTRRTWIKCGMPCASLF